MKLEQIALWAQDLERLRAFYEKYFEASSTAKYRNERKEFESYYLTFPQGGRLELMTRPDIRSIARTSALQEFFGYAHFGISVGSEEAVNAHTARLASDGFKVVDGPRLTGDGYYESQVMDPEGNRILILV